jgi:tRNA dimethylallyltransferase
MTTSDLRRWCERLDPERAALGRTQLLRAVEIALLTGRPMSDWHREPARPPVWTARYLLVDPGAALAGRLVNRTDAMLAAGWVAEAARLAETVPEDAPAWKATGYGVMRSVARGDLDPQLARERVIVETRQYAKRQRTWFRNQLAGARVTMLDPARADWAHAVDAWWHGAEEV